MDSSAYRPGTTCLARFVRGRRLDRNPLRRASDRLETAVLAVLVIAFFAAAPFIAQVCGAAAQAASHRHQLAQQASLHQVAAVVLEEASYPQGSAYTTVAPDARARWTGPGGRTLTGDIPVPAGTRAGTTVPVWVSNSGQPASPPLSDSQVAGQAAMAATAGVAIFGLVIVGAGLAATGVLNERRMAAWESEWRTMGPHWSARA